MRIKIVHWLAYHIFNYKSSRDNISKDILNQTCPTCITEWMTTNSSMNHSTRIGFKTNSTCQLPKNQQKSKTPYTYIFEEHQNTNHKSTRPPFKQNKDNFNSYPTCRILTSLAFGYSTTGLSRKPTAFRTFSSSANHSSCTLLTLLSIKKNNDLLRPYRLQYTKPREKR